jgi:hypothetical protein
MTSALHNNSFRFKYAQRKALTKIFENELSRKPPEFAITSLEHSISQYDKEVAGCTSPSALCVLNQLLDDLDGFNAEFHARFNKYQALAETFSSVAVDWKYHDLDAMPSDDTLCIIGVNDSDLHVAALLVEQVKDILAKNVSAGSKVPDKSLRTLCWSIAEALSQASGKPEPEIRKKKWFREVLAIALTAADVQASPDTMYLLANARQN